MIVGVIFLAFSNSPVHVDNYNLKARVENPVTTSQEVNISAFFEAGQHFFFNFTHGTYWGVKYDVDYGLEPTWTDFAPNASMPAYKIVSLNLSTPSGDTAVPVDVYMVGGTDPYAVVYRGQSADFVPLDGGNQTLGNVGLEGRVVRSGNYTLVLTAIVPLVQKDAGTSYGIVADPDHGLLGDPPKMMSMWNIVSVETKPYFLPFVSVGTIAMLSGAASGLYGGRPKRRSRRHSEKTNR